MNTTMQLRVKPSALGNLNAPYSQQLKNAFIDACLHLDLTRFLPYVDKDEIFDGKDFMVFFKDLYELFRLRYNNLAPGFQGVVKETTCEGVLCQANKGMKVLHFWFTENGEKVIYSDFGFLLEEENGLLINIIRCLGYESAHKIDLTHNFPGKTPDMPSIWYNWEIFQQLHLQKAEEEARAGKDAGANTPGMHGK